MMPDLPNAGAGKRFYYRAVAIIVDRECVLLHRVGANPYWSLPGGGVELLESSRSAVVREVHEELGIISHAERLVWIVENFFRYGTTQLHELGMYYLIAPDDPGMLLQKGDEFTALDGGTTLWFKWFHICEVANIELFPRFLRTGLTCLPAHTEYLVHSDEQTGPLAPR